MKLFIENAPDWQLLMPEEQDLCSKLRLQPKAYLCVKEAIFREAMKTEGKLKKKDVREITAGIDSVKGGRIFEFFCSMGWIDNAAKVRLTFLYELPMHSSTDEAPRTIHCKYYGPGSFPFSQSRLQTESTSNLASLCNTGRIQSSPEHLSLSIANSPALNSSVFSVLASNKTIAALSSLKNTECSRSSMEELRLWIANTLV